MCRVNPNPKIEKLKDFRKGRGVGTSYWENNSPAIGWFCSYKNRALRHHWKQHKWEWEYNEILTFSSYNPRHQVLWDIS